MIWFKDVRSGEIFEKQDVCAEEFQEEYEHPENLIVVDVYYCDGSGYNGKSSSYAYGKKGLIVKFTIFSSKTNNEMEYCAVLGAMKEADKHSVILTDSQLVVYQTIGKWKVKSEHLIKLNEEAANILTEKHLTLRWIPREENIAGEVFE